MNSKDEKSLLRLKFRELRKSVAPGEFAEQAVRDNVRKWLATNLSGREQLCAFRPMAGEPDAVVKPITEVFFPRIEGQSLAFYRPVVEDAFRANRFGILEPLPEGAAVLDLEKPAVVLTPAVAVDSLGRRIGSGQGYYDQFFQRAPKAVRVGVVFHIQVSQSPLPNEGWDQPLDWIITDKMILRVSGRSS